MEGKRDGEEETDEWENADVVFEKKRGEEGKREMKEDKEKRDGAMRGSEGGGNGTIEITSRREERPEDMGRTTGGWEEEIIKYWVETKDYGKKENKDMTEEERGRCTEIIERTAMLERGRRVEGIQIEQMMELIYLRIVTTNENRDEDNYDIMEERAVLKEDVMLANMLEKERQEEKKRTMKKIWSSKKTIRMKMDGGNTEIVVTMAKRSTKLIGIKGIRKMLEWVKIALTLDDRKMGLRNASGDDLRMVGRRHNLPSMTRQDGSG